MSDDFDPEPIRELAADEPRTPLWLPAVGALLFVAALAWWFGGSSDDAAREAPAGSASAGVSGAPAPSAAPATAPKAP